MQPLTLVRKRRAGRNDETNRKAGRLGRRIRWAQFAGTRLAGATGFRLSLAAGAIALGAAAITGGYLTPAVSYVSARAGLGIETIEITGQSQASEVDILRSLAVDPVPSLLTFDVVSARERVEALPWIETAELTKLFPNTLQVAVAERSGFALWQVGGEVRLLDEDGSVIGDADWRRYHELPYLVGEGADARLEDYLALVAAVPWLTQRIRAGVLVSGRRWTLVLNDGVEILLPQEGAREALATIAALDDRTSLLSREIAAVDFRFPEKAILRLTEKGIEERAALLKKTGGAS